MSNTNTDKTKRIVLIGFPGSGKTMLAIGLFKGGDRGNARISVDSEKDAKAVKRLSDFIDKIDKEKTFPAPTQLHLDDKQDGTENNQEEEKNDRSTYPFQILWHGQKFDFEFEDYAGERALNPEYQKEFFKKIVGQQAFGAVLFLNPGMPEFKNQNADDKCEGSSRRPEILSNFYVTAIHKLCESGCKNIVLAITASDLITHGGCLKREHNSIRWLKFKNACRGILNSFRSTKDGSEQDYRIWPRFKMFCKKLFQSVKKAVEDLARDDYASRYSRFKKVRDEIVRTLKLARKNKAWRLNYAVVPVTVTGHLEEKVEGEQRKEVVRLAEGRRNTAAEPFLWIINPWRGRIIKFLKLLAWIFSGVLTVLLVTWLAFRLWYVSRIDEYLNSADAALANFGSPKAAGNFDPKNAEAQRGIAEESLANVENVENTFTFLAREKAKDIDKRLPELLGTLLTNEVELAYYNAHKGIDKNDYNDTNVSLEGRKELKSWPEWTRSKRGRNVVVAADVFREEKTQALIQEYIKFNVEYLEKQLHDAEKALPEDQKLNELFKQVADCLKKITDEKQRDDLKYWQRTVMKHWMSDVSKGDLRKVESRLRAVITEGTDLDVGMADQAINRLVLKGERIQANEVRNKITPYDSACLAANNLYEYITSPSGSKSPFRWYVFDACKEKFNQKVKDVLSLPDRRSDGFEDLFGAAKELKKIHGELQKVGKDDLLEETFGDCALFWLSRDLKDDVRKSDAWLCYDFSCNRILVRTDHLRENPKKEPFFGHKVWATLNLSFPADKSTAVRELKMKENTVEFPKDQNGEPQWRQIEDSSIKERRMKAAEVIKLTVCEGQEDDWYVDVDFPRKSLEFWPGWGDYEDEFAYDSKKEVYPNKVYFCARLGGVRINGGPKKAFDKALASAKAREDSVRTLRNKELEPAEAKLNSAEGNAEGD